MVTLATRNRTNTDKPKVQKTTFASSPYELYIHNSYVILEFVPSTMIFWTEISCWCKNYSHKATLPLGWSHRYKKYMGVITIWLVVLCSVLWCPFCSVRLCRRLFVGGLISFLRYLCLLTHSSVQLILCCVLAMIVVVFT